MVHAALLLLMLEAVHTDLVFTISLKRSTTNFQLSTRTPADYPIFGVISCRGAVKWWCLICPRKLPRQLSTGAAVKGRKQTHAPQHLCMGARSVVSFYGPVQSNGMCLLEFVVH